MYRLAGGEEQQDHDESHPRNSDGADRRRPPTEMEWTWYEFISATCDAKEDGGRV
jgi:hypothetical protein